MPDARGEMLSNIVAALVGAAAALVFTVARDAWLRHKRRKNVASALVYEFRVFRRKVQADLKAVDEHASVVFDPPFSEGLYETLLHELPDLGGDAFLAIRSAYSQLRQINYLKDKLHARYVSAESNRLDNLLESYKAACRQAVIRLDEALVEIGPMARGDALTRELPVVTDLTEEERKWHDSGKS